VGEALSFLKDVDDINLRRRRRVQEILSAELGDLTGKKIAVWGLAFKPDSDDIRDSPALDIVESLARAGAHVTGSDPEATGPATRRIQSAGLEDSVTLEVDHLSAARGADAIVVATEWQHFRTTDASVVANLVNNPLVVDGRNCLPGRRMETSGLCLPGHGSLLDPVERPLHGFLPLDQRLVSLRVRHCWLKTLGFTPICPQFAEVRPEAHG
jgi:UDPglucose 6-dehydrogenase